MLNTDNFLRPMLNKFKKVGRIFQDLYVAEDDLFKIYNFAMKEKFKKCICKANRLELKDN